MQIVIEKRITITCKQGQVLVMGKRVPIYFLCFVQLEVTYYLIPNILLLDSVISIFSRAVSLQLLVYNPYLGQKAYYSYTFQLTILVFCND